MVRATKMLPSRGIYIWDLSFFKPVDSILRDRLIILKKFTQYKAHSRQQYKLAEEGVEVLFSKNIAF